MKFHEFAQLMYPAIGGASSTHAFVKTLFDAIIIEDGGGVLEEVGKDTYKSYFNGNTGISKIAKKLSPYLEPEEFVAFCNEFQDYARGRLCDQFREYLPEITAHNASELLANLFRDIISEAASTKRESPTKRRAEEQRQKVADATGATGFENTEHIEAEVADDDMPSGAAEGDKKITIIQNQTNVVQNGENNFNLTNNGTLNFNF